MLSAVMLSVVMLSVAAPFSFIRPLSHGSSQYNFRNPNRSKFLFRVFVQIRKAGKLPGECFRTDYSLEYGSASVEIQKASIKPGQRILLVSLL